MRSMRASDYHDLVGVSDPRLSPDGEQVAFTRSVPKSDTEYEATIYLVSSGGEGNPRRFTSSDGVDAEPRWSPDGESLAFTSTRGEREEPQLYVLATDGGEARQITDVVGGVSAISWRPDSQRIAFVQSCSPAERREDLDLAVGDAEYEREPPDPRVIDRSIYRAGTQYFDGRHSGVYTVDPATDTVERVTGDGGGGDTGNNGESDGDRPAGSEQGYDSEREYDYVSPTWGDSETLYYAAKRGEDPDDSTIFDIIANDRANDETTTITRTSGWEVTLAATSTGRVAFPYTPEERATLRGTDMRVYDRDAGATHTLTEDIDRMATGPLRWGPDGEEVYFLTPDEGQVAIRAAAVDRVAEDEESVRTIVRDGETTGFDVGSGLAFVRSEWDHPGEVFVTDSGTRGESENRDRSPQRLTEVNAALLGERTLVEPEEVRFESEGTEIQG